MAVDLTQPLSQTVAKYKNSLDPTEIIGGNNANSVMTKILREELVNLEGIYITQNPESGAPGKGGNLYDGNTSFLDEYTNKIFGAPFQLMDSVDKRFDEINKHVGNEYLRNFLINTPILHIKPGMPKYTGGDDGIDIVNTIGNMFLGKNKGMGYLDSFLLELASAAGSFVGGKMQKRMYGFQETYYQYMSYVNYMCRSTAVFLNLGRKTVVTAHGDSMYLDTAKWENYRWLSNSTYRNPSKILDDILRSTVVGSVVSDMIKGLRSDIAAARKGVLKTIEAGERAANAVGQDIVTLVKDGFENTNFWQYLSSGTKKAAELVEDIAKDPAGSLGSAASGLWNGLGSIVTSAKDAIADTAKSTFKTLMAEYDHASKTSIYDVSVDRICSVLFMVEPAPFEENISNTVEPSAIEAGLDAIGSAVGKEIAFITNSNTDLGAIDNLVEFVGGGAAAIGSVIANIVEPVTGGFMSNLFSGAIRSIKGEKMIYPKIYKSSESSQDYNFTISLKTPYGDVYNYYMNILVPLFHLIGLAAPKMITANSIASPFLVQAFIPGMVTCQLGIIKTMTISKNPDNRRVSVNGYPLEIKVSFSIEELYNALSISPANDPAAFLFNETLNDYMANLAGLQPSVNTYMAQRRTALENVGNYFTSGEWEEDLSQKTLAAVENLFNPYARQGK